MISDLLAMIVATSTVEGSGSRIPNPLKGSRGGVKNTRLRITRSIQGDLKFRNSAHIEAVSANTKVIKKDYVEMKCYVCISDVINFVFVDYFEPPSSQNLCPVFTSTEPPSPKNPLSASYHMNASLVRKTQRLVM